MRVEAAAAPEFVPPAARVLVVERNESEEQERQLGTASLT